MSVSFHGWELHSFKEQAKKAPADLRADPSGACKNLAFELRNNPLYLEAMGAFFERGIVRSALHVVGEQAALAIRILEDKADDCWPSELADLRAYSVASFILTAVPFLWLDDVRTSIPPAIGHMVDLNELPYPMMWWTSETDQVYTKDCFRRAGIETDVVPFLDRGIGEIICGFGGVLNVVHLGMDATDRVHISVGEITSPQAHAVIAGKLAFINSPHIQVDRLRVERAARRRAERFSGVKFDPVVHSVQLRRAASVNSEGSAGAPREYVCRWTVRGHFRNQWFPSDKQNRLIWIAPYVKGPDEAPMKKRVYTV